MTYAEPNENKVKDVSEVLRMFNMSKPLKKPLTRRQELNEWFYKLVAPSYEAFKKAPLAKKSVAMKTAHFSQDLLFSLKSQCDDRWRTNGRESAVKFFWYSVKTEKA